jgi:hypothetical protein
MFGDKKKGNKMDNKTKYYDLLAKLEKLEKKHNLYLSDPCVYLENVEWKQPDGIYTNDQYADLYMSACNFAGSRAEEAGFDINKLIGKIIY